MGRRLQVLGTAWEKSVLIQHFCIYGWLEVYKHSRFTGGMEDVVGKNSIYYATSTMTVFTAQYLLSFKAVKISCYPSILTAR